MTPQAFSYGTIGNNGMIYVPPYGLTKCIDYMLKINPNTFKIDKIKLADSKITERWTYGVVYEHKICFLPYNEKDILIVNTDNDNIEIVKINWPENTENINGKYISFHQYGSKIIALPYGENSTFNHVIIFDIITYEIVFKNLILPINDYKKWHTTQIIDETIYGVPRGERWEGDFFPYIIEFNCNKLDYILLDMTNNWKKFDQQPMTNKKYTTLAKSNNTLYAAPYSENCNFDILLKRKDNEWHFEHTNITKTSRKYFSHITAKNGKIYFPPAGHDEQWSKMLIVDPYIDKWYTIDLKIKKESKKYFAGCENSNNKIYFIPRGGCVCEPEETWKSQGDLAEILVINTIDDSFYTIDVSEYFKDNTTIEKYNCCLIYNDIIFALPYGESDSFQTLLIFDTITEKIIRTIDLNEI